ncbi:MAG: 3,4-dihydroxy-2-butanone-4-phosphate synthase [Acidimicrobiales bacterium]|nr:3,4-dihydroxy-2-butanone-4-phosphate synthase [Acidimicrobiales bacterium]
MSARTLRPLTRQDSVGRCVRALEEFTTGRPIVVVDGARPLTDGYLVFAAESATPATLAFSIRHTSGCVSAALPARECDRLRLPPMYPTHDDHARNSYTVTVDAIAEITTGISARERAHTIRTLARAETVASDLARPGHVMVYSVAERGQSRRDGCAAIGVDMARAAGLRPAAAFAAIVSEVDPCRMARGPELSEFALAHHLAIACAEDLAQYLDGLGSGYKLAPERDEATLRCS